MWVWALGYFILNTKKMNLITIRIWHQLQGDASNAGVFHRDNALITFHSNTTYILFLPENSFFEGNEYT